MIVNFHEARVKVVTETMDWPSKPIRRASINSFGYGGANAHAVVDHPNAILSRYETHHTLYHRVTTCTRNSENVIHLKQPSSEFTDHLHKGVALEVRKKTFNNVLAGYNAVPRKRSTENASSRAQVLLPFSANTEPSLKVMVDATGALAKRYNTADLAYTLASRRSRFQCRAYALIELATGQRLIDVESVKFGKARTNPKKLAFVFSGT